MKNSTVVHMHDFSTAHLCPDSSAWDPDRKLTVSKKGSSFTGFSSQENFQAQSQQVLGKRLTSLTGLEGP